MHTVFAQGSSNAEANLWVALSICYRWSSKLGVLG
jgi:hypothetical protein